MMRTISLQRNVAVVVCLLMAIVLTSIPGIQAQEEKRNGKLTWKNGDTIPGNVVSGDSSLLRWQADLFQGPLSIDMRYLDQISFQPNERWLGRTGETYSVQTTDGFSLYGEILKLDDKILTIKSPRIGIINVDRDQIATILNLKTSGSLINGEFDLNNWAAKRNEKKYWKVNDQGALESLRTNIHLYMASELPNSSLIEVELEWNKKLDFILGFGVPRNSRKIDLLPRLESWDDSIVLSYNDDFEIVMESVEKTTKRLKFLIHWDRKAHRLVIHDERGKTLAMADLDSPAATIDSGIYLENKSGDLKVTKLMIRRSSAGFNATEPSLQTVNQAAINGDVLSFDGSNWLVQSATTEGEPVVTVSASDFCGAFLINPAKLRPTDQARVRYHDGMYVRGRLRSITDQAITLQTDFSADPITLALDGVTSLTFDTRPTGQTENFTHRLFNLVGQIQGRLEPGSGKGDDILRWRVAGADSAVPLSRGDARIVLQEKTPIISVDPQWADTLYMKNRDTIPCRIISIDQKHVGIASFLENKRIDQQLVKAVDFRNKTGTNIVNMDDEDWFIPESTQEMLKDRSTEFSLSKGAEFGHPWLLTGGGFEFELSWKKNYFGVLECRTMLGDLMSGEGGKRINIMMYGEKLVVSDPGTNSSGIANITVKGPAKIGFRIQAGFLEVTVNGTRAYREKIGQSLNRGRGVFFKLNDLYNQNIQCSVKNFKLTFSDGGSGSLVDPERKELLLTIPRLKKNNPPKQILCASNSDMLRGELISLDDQYVMFRSNNEVKRYPRDIIASVVWLHADDLTFADESGGDRPAAGGSADELGYGDPDFQAVVASLAFVEESNDRDNQTVQVLMHGGRRMTTTLESWIDGNLAGNSLALGKFKIPFDQIYELRFGSFADEATDVPFSDWVARLAPAPKMDAGADGQPGSEYVFGSSSPLIGTTPKSFRLPMVGGETFSMKSQIGKVVVLDFWATWCGPCIQAMPKIKKTIDGFSADEVTLLAINLEEDIEKVKLFLEARQFELPVGLDSGKVGEQFQVTSVPMTIVIDQAGTIVFVKVGTSNGFEERLKSAIDGLLDTDETVER